MGDRKPTKQFMKSFRRSNTDAYNPFVSRNYHEGRECELDYRDTSGITKPFSRLFCLSFAHNLPKLIFPRHLQEFYASYSVDPIFSSFNMSNLNIAVEHGASSSQAQQMNPKEQIKTETNSWFEKTTWDDAEWEISPDEVLGKEEEEKLSFGERMACKSYLSTKRQHRES
ncbi:hypothetical protein Tco_0289523 [Tanacetum coccineum]